jgi:hypothetical protein
MTVLPVVTLRVAGDDVLRFLHDTSTQDLLGLEPGEGARTCFLDDKGRVQAEARALVIEDGAVLLVAEDAARAYLTGWLARIAPLSGCTVSEEDVVVTAVRGPDADGVFATFPTAEHHHIRSDGMRVVRTEWGGRGYDVLARGPVRLDAREADPSELDAERIRFGRPRFGVDVTPDMLVNETPFLERAVAMDKGCYPGQESVARVQNLGSIRRHFVLVRMDGPAPPVPTAVRVDDEEIGSMTSATDGAGIACLRATVGSGRPVMAGDVPGMVERIL